MIRWVLIAALGCGAAPPTGSPAEPAHATDAGIVVAIRDAAALDDDLPRLAARSVDLFQDLARALGTSSDCPALTEQVGVLATRYADVAAATARVYKSGLEKQHALKRELASHQADIDRAVQAIAAAPSILQCGRDPAFAEAIDRLTGGS